MVAYFETGQAHREGVCGLFIWSFSRFAREFMDAQFYINTIRRAGYIVQSLTDNIPEGEFGPLVETIVFLKDAQFSRDLSKHIRRSQRFLLNNYHPEGTEGGLYVLPETGEKVQLTAGGFPPVGYERHLVQTGQNRRGTPRFNAYWKKTTNKDLANNVRLAWEMVLNGSSYSEIEEKCHLGLGKNSYKDFFNTITYTGTYSYGEFIKEGAFEPYITREEFEKVQELIAARSPKRLHSPSGYYQNSRPSRYRYLLSGLIRCGHCGLAWNGGKLTSSKAEYKYWYYDCSARGSLKNSLSPCPAATRRIRAERLEGAVLTTIAKLLEPEYITGLLGHLAEEREKKKGGFSGQVGELEKIIQLETEQIRNLALQLPTAAELGIEQDVKIMIGQAKVRRDQAQSNLEKLKIKMFSNSGEGNNGLKLFEFDNRLIKQARTLLLDLSQANKSSGELGEDARITLARRLLEDLNIQLVVYLGKDDRSGRQNGTKTTDTANESNEGGVGGGTEEGNEFNSERSITRLDIKLDLGWLGGEHPTSAEPLKNKKNTPENGVILGAIEGTPEGT